MARTQRLATQEELWSPPPRGGGRLGRRRAWQRRGWVAVFVLPAVALYGTIAVYPMATAFSYSFFDWDGLVRGPVSGLANYGILFTTFPFNEQLAGAFRNNLTYFVGTWVIQNGLGLGLALLLHRDPRGKRFFQVLFSTPYLISPLVVGYLWTLILSPLYGPLSQLFRTLGWDSLVHPWLGDPNTALGTVILITAWQWAGFPMLIFGAALAAVPQEYFDAATVDGAGWFQMLRKITLPLLLPAIGIVTILTFVGAFNVFDIVYAVGGSVGGPAGATDMLVLLFYRVAFGTSVNAIGISSALAVMLFLTVFGAAAIANRALKRREMTLR